jgi:hypothetical protein
VSHPTERRAVVVAVVFCLAMLACNSALAGPYADDLARCLVRSTSDADKTALVKWIFASAAVHPDVRTLAAVSEGERTELNRVAAKLFERLITDSCRQQTVEAVKYEGAAGLQTSFEVLGQVAGRGLLADPAVVRSLAEFERYIDKDKVNQLLGPRP